MKRFLSIAAFLVSLGWSHARASGWPDMAPTLSSFTATADSYVAISSRGMQGGIFVGVVISSSANGSVAFFDSLGLVQSTIGVVSLFGTGVGQGASFIPFGVTISSGLVYRVQGNNSGMSILYKKRIPN